jgi:hypothetical protein
MNRRPAAAYCTSYVNFVNFVNCNLSVFATNAANTANAATANFRNNRILAQMPLSEQCVLPSISRHVWLWRWQSRGISLQSGVESREHINILAPTQQIA